MVIILWIRHRTIKVKTIHQSLDAGEGQWYCWCFPKAEWVETGLNNSFQDAEIDSEEENTEKDCPEKLLQHGKWRWRPIEDQKTIDLVLKLCHRLVSLPCFVDFLSASHITRDFFYLQREIDQTFISYVWIYMVSVFWQMIELSLISHTFCNHILLLIQKSWFVKEWDNDYISWNKEDFCGISSVAIPIEALWKPDLTIEEM